MFYLRNFKNFEEAELDYERPVSLLIGPNGAGKSNLIEAIEMLSFLANGRPLHEITDYGREGGLEVRGGLDACASYGEKSFTLGHRSVIETPAGPKEACYEISIRVGKDPRIIQESLSIEGRATPIFEVLPSEGETTSADNQVRYDNNNKGGTKPTAAAAADRSALSQYARFASGNKKLSETLQIIESVSQALGSPAVFDPIPRLMRNYERETDTKLARNGSNISPVLRSLYRSSNRGLTIILPKRKTLRRLIDLGTAERILRRIKQLPDEPFDGFDFIETKAGDVMFGFKTKHEKKPIPARVLSDGTLRALAILAALETSPARQRLILEEFDNGVHPSRVHILSEALFDCAERNKLRVVATTQNPATLNALTDAQLDSVLFVVRQPGEKFARLLPLKDLPGYIDFIEQGRLGDLVTRRVYERHLAPDYEEERIAETEKWLESLP